MNTLLPISIYIITLNEEKNIRATLSRMTHFDEVILVDSGSTDKTLDIAKEYANVSVYHHEWPGFSEQKAFALSLCRNEWVLNIDADELLTDEFITAMANTVRENEYDALESKRILLRWGKIPRHFSKPDRLIRFFRKSNGHYENRRVHESISVIGKVKQSDAAILHCENHSYSERIAKSNKYSELSALDKFDNGKSASLLKLVFSFPVAFIKLYFLKGHFLGGMDGFLTSMNAAFYAFMKYAKLWEMQKKHSNSWSEDPDGIPGKIIYPDQVSK